jgi:putative ATP-dependent endonuclease of OLD family
MHVAAVVARGFRNLEGRIPLCRPLSVLVGENNAGKSNAVDAMRLLFRPEAGPRARLWLTEQDFRHDGKGKLVTDQLDLEAELHGLTADDQARLVTCLSPSLGTGTARLRLRATLAPNKRVEVEWFGGDSQHPDLERWARDAVTYTYLHPLRDAEADLRPGRENRLVALLSALAPEGHEDRETMERITMEANVALGGVPALEAARDRVQTRLERITGAGRFTQRTDLVFADPRFSRIVAAVRALAGSLEPLELAENGLGYNNLVYMAVVLAELSDPGESALRLLLVEEPEAHLHPQLQDLLMQYLEAEGQERVQVIMTSHSPNFASAARVERITVMVADGPEQPVSARAPMDFGLTPVQMGHLRRFLDVTKAALLFARAVILVEGVAEQLLVPVIARRLGRPLSQHGVAVINVGGVAFGPFIELFGADRLPYRCAVISDGDPPVGPDPDETEGADPGLSAVARDLLGRQGPNLQVHLAERTLEWDLAQAGNWTVLLDALRAVKPRVAASLTRDLAAATPTERADRLLEKVDNVKGRFAQELADIIDSGSAEFAPPPYLRRAIMWVTGADPGA